MEAWGALLLEFGKEQWWVEFPHRAEAMVDMVLVAAERRVVFVG